MKNRTKQHLSALFILLLLAAILVAPATAASSQEENPLPTICIGYSNTSAYSRTLALYPNGDLWELYDYEQPYLDAMHRIGRPQTDTQQRILTGVKDIGDRYILQHDGTLWALAPNDWEPFQPHDGAGAPVRMMEQVAQVYGDYSGLILQTDGSLWSWQDGSFDETKRAKLLGGVTAIHDDWVAETADGTHYLLKEQQDGRGNRSYLVQELPAGFQALVGLNISNWGVIVTGEAIYSTALDYLMDMTEVKQVTEVGMDIFVRKENGEVWEYDWLRTLRFELALTDVAYMCSDYFYHSDGSYSDQYLRPMDTIITPDMLEHAIYNEKNFLITEDNELYQLGRYNRDLSEAEFIADDVKKVIPHIELLHMFTLIKTDGTLCFFIHDSEGVLAGEELEIKLDEGVADCVIEEEATFVIKENGAVWCVKYNDIGDITEAGLDPNDIYGFYMWLADIYRPWNARCAVQYGDLPVYLNGRHMTFDVPPFAEQNRTFVPVRVIAEELGAEVTWDDGTVTITRENTTITLQIDSPVAIVDGETHTLDVSACARDGRTFVPLRFIAEALDFEVNWTDGAVVLDAIKA